MLGSISSDGLPIDDSGTPGSRELTARAPSPDAAHHEPAAATPLLRERGAALVEAGGPMPADVWALAWPVEASERVAAVLEEPVETSGSVETSGPVETVESVVAQLAPIQSQASLASSFHREANPHDPVVREAYACAWADLAMRLSLGKTRRARHQATLAEARRTPVRGRG